MTFPALIVALHTCICTTITELKVQAQFERHWYIACYWLWYDHKTANLMSRYRAPSIHPSHEQVITRLANKNHAHPTIRSAWIEQLIQHIAIDIEYTVHWITHFYVQKMKRRDLNCVNNILNTRVSCQKGPFGRIPSIWRLHQWKKMFEVYIVLSMAYHIQHLIYKIDPQHLVYWARFAAVT